MSEEKDNVVQIDETQQELVNAMEGLHKNARTGDLRFIIGCVITKEGELLFYQMGALHGSHEMTRVLGAIEHQKIAFNEFLMEQLLEEEEDLAKKSDDA